MKKDNKTEAAARLRERAEALLKKKSGITSSQISETERKKPLKAGALLSEADTLKLIHELEVHQVELELQNKELLEAKEQAETDTKKYTELYDFAPAGYFTLSKEGEIVQLNLSGAKMLGKERSRLVNRLFGLYVSENTRQVFNDFFQKVFESRIKEAGEVALSINDNLPMYVHITGIVTENGERCLVTANEITERKKAEEEIRESEEKFRLIFENNSSAIAIIEPDSTITMVNEEYCKVSGYKKQEVIGMSWTQQIPQEDLERLKEFNRRRLINPKDAPDKYEFKFRQKNGEIKHALMSINMLSNRKIIASFIDITERKKAEEELRESEENLRKINAEKDKFFSIIAHDLRSPFNGFLGLTEIMAEGLHGMTLDEIQEIAVNMKKSANNLYGLLENLLEWSRMQRGLTAFEPKLFLLMPIITESMALVTERADKKEIAISYDIPKDLSVFADGNMFECIIRNLSSNAVKFTPKGGVVNISAKTMPDKTVEISIKDTGIGMGKDITDNIFRLDINTSREGTEGESSTGLGLIICKDFIEKHGGELQVVSEEGKGSMFYFTIPFESGGGG